MFIDRLKAACNARKVDLTPLVVSLGYSSGNISKWKNGVIPNGKVVADLADALSVSTDYLLERENLSSFSEKGMIFLDAQEKSLFENLRLTTDENRIAIYKMANALMSSPIGEKKDETHPFSAPNSQPIDLKKRAWKVEKPGLASVSGHAAAGAAMEIYDSSDESARVPAKYLDSHRYVRIVVNGDSMTGDDIQSGDLCVFRADRSFEEGDIVAVTLEGVSDSGSGLIKHIYYHPGRDQDGEDASYTLVSSNPEYAPIEVPAREVENVTGSLVAIIPASDWRA